MEASCKLPVLLLITIWLWVKTVLVPFEGWCTTHFRTYFSGWIGSRSLGVQGCDPWPSVTFCM